MQAEIGAGDGIGAAGQFGERRHRAGVTAGVEPDLRPRHLEQLLFTLQAIERIDGPARRLVDGSEAAERDAA